jgi:hypothetical protein
MRSVKLEVKVIFIARYNDGTCGITEATDEANARELLQSDGALFDPERDTIISLRPSSRKFVSRWFFDLKDSNDPIEVDRLCGMLGHDLSEEITELEYPMIAAAHATCELEEPFFDQDADQETPIFHNPRQLKQMNRWNKNLLRRLRQAIDLEIKRSNLYSRTPQN